MKTIIIKFTISLCLFSIFLLLNLIQVKASNRISFTLVILPAPKPIISESNILITTQEGLEEFIKKIEPSTVNNNNINESVYLPQKDRKDKIVSEAGKSVLITALSCESTPALTPYLQTQNSIYYHSPEQGSNLQLKC